MIIEQNILILPLSLYSVVQGGRYPEHRVFKVRHRSQRRRRIWLMLAWAGLRLPKSRWCISQTRKIECIRQAGVGMRPSNRECRVMEIYRCIREPRAQVWEEPSRGSLGKTQKSIVGQSTMQTRSTRLASEDWFWQQLNAPWRPCSLL